MRRRKSSIGDINFKDWTYKTKLNHHESVGSVLRVEAISVACGGKYAHEIETFLISTRAHHKEHIYLIADKKAEEIALKTMEEYSIDDVTILVIDDKYERMVGSICRNVISHDSYWSHIWIYAKLDMLRRALSVNSGRGVLLLDCDIILNSRISEEWDADLVMSAHSLSDPGREIYQRQGFYNAGMVLTNRVGIVNDWINLYLEGGANSFYEQKCLQTLGTRWVCDVFSENHNFGKWRREDLFISKRKVRSFHLHLDENIIYPEQKSNIMFAQEAFERNKQKLLLEKSEK